MARLLVLGGTGDAKLVLSGLQALPRRDELELIYAIAGLVRPAKVDCEVVSGGFSQFGGLGHYVREQAIDLIVDCTHPYAAQISGKAVAASAECGVPCWRLHRQRWQAESSDHWQNFASWDELFPQLVSFRSVMITSGQLSKTVLVQWQQIGGQQKQLLRTAVTPEYELPASMIWHQAIGPFTLADELALMQAHDIDVLVSKNSGGDATAAKLIAARQLGIPVMMIDRPSLPDCDCSFDSVEELVTAVRKAFKQGV